MKAYKDTLHLRILIGATLIGLFIVGITAYNVYSEEVKHHVAEKMAELVPEMDSALAQL